MAFKRLKKDHSPCGTPKFLDGSVAEIPINSALKKCLDVCTTIQLESFVRKMSKI